MKSVEATRLIPRRCATSTATVDLPVPVEPPIRHDHRHVELLQIRQPPEAVDRALALHLAEHLASEHVEPLERRRRLAGLGEIELDPPRQRVRLVGRHAGGDQRPRHQSLRVRQVLVAERQRLRAARL